MTLHRENMNWLTKYGDPAVSFFASAYNKGIRNYDAELAYDGLLF